MVCWPHDIDNNVSFRMTNSTVVFCLLWNHLGDFSPGSAESFTRSNVGGACQTLHKEDMLVNIFK